MTNNCGTEASCEHGCPQYLRTFSYSHDVAEVAGIVCHAFGEEGVDRHIMLFKKEYELSAEELAALRRGEEYDPVKAKEEAFQVSVANV